MEGAVEKMDAGKARTLMLSLPLSVTGAVLTPAAPLVFHVPKLGGTVRLRMRTRSHAACVLPPCGHHVLGGLLLQHPDMFETVLHSAQRVPHFKGFTPAQIKTWLLKHADALPNHTAVGLRCTDLAGRELDADHTVVVEHVTFNRDLLEPMKQRPDLPGPRLPEGTQRALLQKPTTMRATLRTILAVGEATPGAAAKMRSDALEGAYMGFRRGVMQHISARVVSQHTGCTLHVQRGTVTFGSHACAETEEMYVLPRALNDDPTAAGGKSHHTWSDVAFCVPKEAAAGLSAFHIADDELREICSAFLSTNALKSAMQKVARCRPPHVVLPSQRKVSGGDAIEACVTQLLHPRQPGQFIPDANAFVTALTSCLKRLAVIAWEDADSTPTHVASLLMGGLLSSHLPTWRPGTTLVAQWKAMGRALYNAPVRYHWDRRTVGDTDAKRVCTLQALRAAAQAQHAGGAEQQALQLCSLLLDELKSMKGDLLLFRWHAARRRGAAAAPHSTCVAPRQNIHFPAYCLDQHVVPNIVLLLHPRNIYTKYPPRKKSEPFGPLLDALFRYVTGKNPRLGPMTEENHWHTEIVREVQQAQAIVYDNMRALRDGSGGGSGAGAGGASLCFTVPRGYLAGGIGPISVRTRTPKPREVLVTLDPNNLLHWVVIPRPARDTKDPSLPDMVIEDAQKQARALARTGMTLSKLPALDPLLHGAHVRLETDGHGEDAWMIRLAQQAQWKPWEQARHITISGLQKVPTPTEIRDIVGKTLAPLCGDDPSLHVKVVQRVATLLSHYRSRVDMPRISRGGGSLKDAVSVHDCAAYQLLLALAHRYPDALTLGKTALFTFDVASVPVMRELRRCLVASASAGAVHTRILPTLRDTEQRELRSSQCEALDEMLASLKGGEVTGFFLHMTTGMGKTLVVSHLLNQWRGTNATGVLWTVTASGVTSVATELDKVFRGAVDILEPTKAAAANAAKAKPKPKKGHDVPATVTRRYRKKADDELLPLPNRISIVAHDNLKRMPELLSVAAHTAVVVDEVHECMASSQRTECALRLARLSPAMVCLTGTAVCSSSSLPIIAWLEQCIPFAVTVSNFWTACNGMISKLVSTGVTMVASDVEVAMPHPIFESYRQYVPAGVTGMVETDAGPVRLGGINPKPANTDFEHAVERCYDDVIAPVLAHRAAVLVGAQYSAARVPLAAGVQAKKTTLKKTSRSRKVSEMLQDTDSDSDDSAEPRQMPLPLPLVPLTPARVRAQETAALAHEARVLQSGAVPDIMDLPQRVVIVGRHASHCQRIAQFLLYAQAIPARELLLLGYRDKTEVELFPPQDSAPSAAPSAVPCAVPCADSIYMTEQNVKEGELETIPRIVIVPQSRDTGWTGTWCTVMLTAVYPSNQARRRQMEARINRLSCERKVRWYERYHTGVLTWMLNNHLRAQSMDAALRLLAQQSAAPCAKTSAKRPSAAAVSQKSANAPKMAHGPGNV